jgi:hypothetical protein
MAEEPFALTIPGPPATEAEYDGICAAVMETGRGRWFLTEYARRNRHADTQVLLAALARIEAAIRREPAPDENATTPAKAEPRTVAAARPLDDSDHSTAPRNIANALENATTAIRATTERLQDISWRLRERQYDDKFCDEIEARTAEISRACVVLDVAAAAAHDVATLIAEPDSHAAAPASAPATQASAPPLAAGPATEQASPAEAAGIPWYLQPEEAEGDWDQSERGDSFEAEATPVLALWQLPERMPEEAQLKADAALAEPATSIMQPVAPVAELSAMPLHPAAASAVAETRIDTSSPAPTLRMDEPEDQAPQKIQKTRAPDTASGGWLSSLLTRIASGEEDEDGEAPAAPKAMAKPVVVVSAPAEPAKTVAAAGATPPATAMVETPASTPVGTPDPAPVMTVESEPAAASLGTITEPEPAATDRLPPAPAIVAETRDEIMVEATIETKLASADTASPDVEDDPAGFLLEPLPAAFSTAAAPLHFEARKTEAAKPRDPFAPLRAMSEEEKIALFS